MSNLRLVAVVAGTLVGECTTPQVRTLSPFLPAHCALSDLQGFYAFYRTGSVPYPPGARSLQRTKKSPIRPCLPCTKTACPTTPELYRIDAVGLIYFSGNGAYYAWQTTVREKHGRDNGDLLDPIDPHLNAPPTGTNTLDDYCRGSLVANGATTAEFVLIDVGKEYFLSAAPRIQLSAA